MVNTILCITIYILCNNVLFYHYRVSQEDGSMPCDNPVILGGSSDNDQFWS